MNASPCGSLQLHATGPSLAEPAPIEKCSTLGLNKSCARYVQQEGELPDAAKLRRSPLQSPAQLVNLAPGFIERI